jgi:hypothetical protein
MKLAFQTPSYTEYMFKQVAVKLPFGFKFVLMAFKRVNHKPFEIEKFAEVKGANYYDVAVR